MAKQLREKGKEHRSLAEKMRKALEIVTVIVELQYLNKKKNQHTTTDDLCQYFPVKTHVMERIKLARIGEPPLIYGRISGKRSTHLATTRGCMLVVVHWIGRHGVGSVEQVMKRFHMERKDAERILHEAFDEDMLIRAGTLFCEPEVYVATEKGLEDTGLIHLTVAPLAARVEGHLRACVDAAIDLELALGPAFRVLSEREVVALNGRKQGSMRLASPFYYVIDSKLLKTAGFVDDIVKRLVKEGGERYNTENLRGDVVCILSALRAEGIESYREGKLLEAIDRNLVKEVDLLVHELAMKKCYKTPDLVVVREDGNGEEVIAIEVELTYKGAVFTAILNCYEGCPTIDRVEYRTSPSIISMVERDHAGLERGSENGVDDGEAFDSEDFPEEDLDGYEESDLVQGWELAEPDLDSTDEATEDHGQAHEPLRQDKREGPRVPILIEEMAPEDVPALRRMPFYKPLPVCSEADELFRAASRNPKWHTDIKPQLLSHMEWIGLNGMVTADALAVCFALPGGCEEARESLLLAHGAGWLNRTELLRAEGEIFFATEEGLKEVGMDPKAWLVNYDYVAHYALSGSTCMRTRVGAHLAQEFPDLVIKTRWELRVDGFFSGAGMMNVSKVTKFSGEHKYADITLVDEGNPAAPYGIVLIYPYLVQLDRVKSALAWLVHPRCGKLLLYIDDEKLRKAVQDFVKEHEQSERMSVLPLPISERERILRIERSHQLTKAAEDERYLLRSH